MVSDPQEEALSRLLAWINDIEMPMFIVRKVSDDRLEYVHANDAVGKVAGFDSSILAGQSAHDVFDARTAAKLDTNYRECLRSDGAVSYEECVMIDGRETFWETTLSKPKGFDNRIVLGIAVSTTHRKEKEFANAGALADLSAQLDGMKLFSTMAAHDARSPLATVSSLIDLVMDGFTDMGDGKAELLKLCAKTVEEALEQITATLERGRNLERSIVSEERVEMARLCDDIAAMVDPEMQLLITSPTDVVECDEIVVQMGIRNLMSNAARYCQSQILVSVATSDTAGMIDIDVVDDGAGLPDGTTLRDLSQAAEARGDGHGFGLKSISNLLNSHGGHLQIVEHDRPDDLAGACFRMTLPGRIIMSDEAGEMVRHTNLARP